MHKKSSDVRRAAVLVALFATGCSLSPRNGTVINSKYDPVTFAGFWPVSGGPQTLDMTAENRGAGTYDPFISALVSSSNAVYSDSTGAQWWSYNFTATLPPGDKYWIAHSDNSLWLYTRTTVRGTSVNLTTFEPNAEDCLEAGFNYLSGAQLAQACASPNSPDVRIILPAGKEGGLCTKTKECDPGLVCVLGTPKGSECLGTYDSLVGDTSCRFGYKNCNPPVVYMQKQLGQLRMDPNKLLVASLHYPSQGYYAPRLDAEEAGPFGIGNEHIQSVVRLVSNGNNWFAYGHSTDSNDQLERAGLMFSNIGQFPKTGGYGFNTDALTAGVECNGRLPPNCPINRNWTRFSFTSTTFASGSKQGTGRATAPTSKPLPFPPAALGSEVNHPNGMQAVGNLIAVTTWCQPHPDDVPPLYCSTVNDMIELSIIDASDPMNPVIINKTSLYQGLYGQTGGSAVGMARLSSGRYLVALVEGKLTFLISDRKTIDADTKWLVVPSTLTFNDSLDRENLNLLTDDEGDIWAVGMGPIQDSDDGDSTWVEARKLKSDGHGGITTNQDVTGVNACNGSPSAGVVVCGQGDHLYRRFNSGDGDGRAGVGMFVTPDGALRMYGTSLYGSDGSVWILEH